MFSKKLKERFMDYAMHHKTRANQLCHYFGIPMIVVSLLGLLANVSLLTLNASLFLLFLVLLRYFFLDWKITLPFGLIALGIYFFAMTLPLSFLWGLFILGWVFQFIGHYAFEKKSPSFFHHADHLLIGPLWVFVKIFRLNQ